MVDRDNHEGKFNLKSYVKDAIYKIYSNFPDHFTCNNIPITNIDREESQSH